MNKQVKKFRTTTRNRQTHAVTSAYMELDLIYSMIRKRNDGIHTGVYIDCLRDQFLEMQEDFRLDAEARALAAASAEGAMHDDEEENLEIDFEYDVPDLGRDALAALLAAAGVQEHGDFGM